MGGNKRQHTGSFECHHFGGGNIQVTHGIVLVWYQMFVREANHQWLLVVAFCCAFINLAKRSTDFTLKVFLFKMSTSVLHNNVLQRHLQPIGVRLSHFFVQFAAMLQHYRSGP